MERHIIHWPIIKEKYMECVRYQGMRKIVCISCGGSGETPNDNHYLADTSWEY